MAKIVVLGLHGLDPELARPWSNDLPNLMRMQKEGIWGRLECTGPKLLFLRYGHLLGAVGTLELTASGTLPIGISFPKARQRLLIQKLQGGLTYHRQFCLTSGREYGYLMYQLLGHLPKSLQVMLYLGS